MESDCVIHTGYISNAGYGLTYNPETKKTISAHRKAFKDAHGYLPKVVMHICDTPTCVNPQHLIAGTQSMNILDCVSKGRYNNSKRKLSKEDVEHIYSSSFSQRALAKYYGVTQRVIWGIKNHKTYCEWTGHGGSCGV